MSETIKYTPEGKHHLSLKDGGEFEFVYYEEIVEYHGQRFRRRISAVLTREGKDIQIKCPDSNSHTTLNRAGVFGRNNFMEISIDGSFNYAKSGGGLSARTTTEAPLDVFVSFLDFNILDLNPQLGQLTPLLPQKEENIENGMHLLHKDRMKVSVTAGHDVRIYSGAIGASGVALIFNKDAWDSVNIQSLKPDMFNSKEIHFSGEKYIHLNGATLLIKALGDTYTIEILPPFNKHFWLEVTDHEDIEDQDTWDEDDPTEETSPLGTTLPDNLES